MSFKSDDHNTASTELGSTKVQTSVWINEVVCVCLTIDTGSCHVHERLNALQTQAMIDMLNQHLDYIKAAEIELLALQTKVA